MPAPVLESGAAAPADAMLHMLAACAVGPMHATPAVLASVLRAIDQAVKVRPVEQEPTELLPVWQRETHARQMPRGVEVADRPRAHAEIAGSAVHVEETRCHRAHFGHSTPTGCSKHAVARES